MTHPLPHAGKAPGDHGRRIPSLDGLRAISILFVILAHSAVTTGFPHPVFRLMAPFDLGNVGVRVFFAISGFLITRLLLDERLRSGRIDLQHFYFRRVFRIFPAYFTYLGVVLLLAGLGLIAPIGPRLLVHVLTFTVNYAVPVTQSVGHFWSLAVEEQFYLLWPPILAWAGPRRAFRWALLLLLVAPVLRLVSYQFVPTTRPYLSSAFPTIGDAIAVGCLLARWRDDLWKWAPYRRLLESRWFALVPLAAISVTIIGGRPRIFYLFGMTIETAAIVLSLDWALRFSDSRVGRVLNSAALVWIGTLSYSLYVWQELFLDSHFTSPWLRFPLNVCWAAFAGVASYYVIERPALRFRGSLERRQAARRTRDNSVEATT